MSGQELLEGTESYLLHEPRHSPDVNDLRLAFHGDNQVL